MKYLRKSGVVRLLVAVLDVNSIPDDVDIVVDDCLYDIFFHVESVVKGDDDNFDDADDLDNDDEQFPQDQEMEDQGFGIQFRKKFGPNRIGRISVSFRLDS